MLCRCAQEELHQALLPYGINTQAIDRYVVTQQRQVRADCEAGGCRNAFTREGDKQDEE